MFFSERARKLLYWQDLFSTRTAKKMATLLSTNTACLAIFRIITLPEFIQTPYSSSSREPTARRRSLWRKRWRGEDSRPSPCISEVNSPFSPSQMPWEKLGRLRSFILFQDQLKTAPMSHLHGAQGQCCAIIADVNISMYLPYLHLLHKLDPV